MPRAICARSIATRCRYPSWEQACRPSPSQARLLCLTLADTCTSALVRSVPLCDFKVDYILTTMAAKVVEWLATLAVVPAAAPSTGTVERFASRPRSGLPLLASPTQPIGLGAGAA